MAKDKRTKSVFDPKKILTGQRPGQSRLTFAADQVIYVQGAPADAAFFIEKGTIKISIVSPSGKEAVVAIRRDGEFFGTRCLIDRRAGSTTALTECSLIRLTRAALTALLHEEPDFAVMFAVALVQYSVRDQDSIVDHLTNPAEKRLARTLLLLADGLEDDEMKPISSRIDQATLANMIGTTRSRVSFFMNKFKRQGQIDYDRNGGINVRSSLRNSLRSTLLDD